MLHDSGTVIIGRNEGERLTRCLRSVSDSGRKVVYVDSGSTDGSVQSAAAAGCEVVRLLPSSPFTAARARNAGFERLLRLQRDLDFVQFVDGDCELDAGWLDRAERELRERPDAGIVCGVLTERSPSSSIYNRLCQMEWKGSIGEVDECGGIFMVRVSAFCAARGFRPDMIGGEEPDLCLRLRQAGWKVVRVAAAMATHDAAMTTLAQWSRRAVRYGYACAARQGRTWTRSMASSLAWGGVLPAAMVASLAAATLMPQALAVAGLIAAAYGVLALRVYRFRCRFYDDPADAALYAVFCVLSKLPQCWGMWTYWTGRHAEVKSRPSVERAVVESATGGALNQ